MASDQGGRLEQETHEKASQTSYSHLSHPRPFLGSGGILDASPSLLIWSLEASHPYLVLWGPAWSGMIWDGIWPLSLPS